MILIRTTRQIRTGGTIPNFYACQTLSHLDWVWSKVVGRGGSIRSVHLV
jgi:hypothetical protein